MIVQTLLRLLSPEVLTSAVFFNFYSNHPRVLLFVEGFLLVSLRFLGDKSKDNLTHK